MKPILVFSLFFFLTLLSALGKERDDFPFGEKKTFTLDQREEAPAFRIQSFGQTEFFLETNCNNCSKNTLKVIVEGPLPDYGDKTPIGSGPILIEFTGGEKNKVASQVKLEKEGLYRLVVLASSDSKKQNVQLSLRTDDLKNTSRPSESLSQIMSKLRNAEQVRVLKKLEEEIKYALPDPATHGPILQRLKKIQKEKSWKDLERFPTLPPPHELKKFRPLLDGFKKSHPLPSGPLVADLGEWLKSQKVVREHLGDPILTKPFPVTYGHYNSKTLPKEILNQSPPVAQVLNALSLFEQSLITAKEPQTGGRVELRTPKELFQFLIKTGHQIELREERTYANFLSLESQNKYSRIPVWLDTGVKLPDGTSLKVPLSHSHLSWRVTGPIVNARVAFFLGATGVGFFPQIDERPAWTGLVTKQSFSTKDGDHDLILRSVEAAQSYMERIKLEQERINGGLPLDGYGTLGVCNDSTAALLTRLGIQKEVELPYPLVRASDLPDVGKGTWSEVFRKLPHDTQMTESDLTDERQLKRIMCRVLATTPYSLDSADFPDEELKRQLKLVAELTRGDCEPQKVKHRSKTH